MGRFLEALRKEDVPRRLAPAQEDQPPILCRLADEPAAQEPVPETCMPFIEVGPRHSVEGSPDVLAAAPPRAVQPAHVAFRPHTAGRLRAPHGGFAPELVAFHAPDLPAGGQYRELFASLLPTARGAGPQAFGPGQGCAVVLFTAARPGVGATTVALNVAITAARQRHRHVVVVDADLQHASVAERLGLPPAPGLREVFSGAARLDDAVRPTDQPHLGALTAGLYVPGPGPRFVAETMRSVLRQLRQRTDLVVMDGPCWDERAEVRALAAAADAVYAVLPEKEAETPEADALLQAITDHGARLAGCILAAR